jgi:hypothetical protein
MQQLQCALISSRIERCEEHAKDNNQAAAPRERRKDWLLIELKPHAGNVRKEGFLC